jgi:hypothetical protein
VGQKTHPLGFRLGITQTHRSSWFEISKNYTSIIEDPNHGQQNMGGTSRPISGETIDLANKIIRIYIQTSYTTINGDNCEYFTELTFKKTQEW